MVGSGAPEGLILRSTRKKALTTGLVVSYFTVSAVGALVGSLFEEDKVWRVLAIPLAVPFLVGAVWFSHRGRGFFGGRQSEVARLLLEPRGDVVWIYPYEFVVRPYGVFPLTFSKSVVIGCLDGRRFYLPVPLGTGDQLQEAVRSCVPHACVGYSKERESKFKKGYRWARGRRSVERAR